MCGGMFLRQWREYRTAEKNHQDLMEKVLTEPSSPSESPGADPVEKIPHIDFEALEEINPQIVGWLYLPDTIISYPVVQGEDNSYYLKHLLDGTENSSGCPFLDSRCNGLQGKNSVIYGHYMKNDTLFAPLKEYQNQEYYEAHPTIFLIRPEETLRIQLFSAYITGTENEDPWQLNFSSDEEYGAWLEKLQERSSFETDVIPTVADQVITLSTCNYTFQNARFVCHGRVVKE